MGFLSTERHDAFLSYARDDNINDYIGSFRTKLVEKCIQELGKEKKPDLFIDSKGLPENGDLTDEIVRAITMSACLFIFVGPSYVRSKWCSHELATFRNLFQGKRVEALKRLFVVVLDQRVELSPWGEFLDTPERPKYITFYNSDGTTLLPYSRLTDTDAVPNAAYDHSVARVARTFCARLHELRESPLKPPPPPTKQEAKVVLGLVTPDLEQARDELADQLNSLYPIEKVTLADIATGCAFDDKLRNAQIFIQPYSRAPVLLPGIAGGHLAMQEQQIAHRMQIIWWSHASDPARVTTAGVSAETAPEHVKYLQRLDASALSGTPAVVTDHVRTLVRRPGIPTSSARVWIESGEDDFGLGWELGGRLETLWGEEERKRREADHKYRGTQLEYRPLPWIDLTEDDDVLEQWVKTCHGILLLFGVKRLDSLTVQVQTIDGILATASPKPGKAVAIVPPRKRHGQVFWRTFDCRRVDDATRLGELQVEDDALREFLKRVHAAATVRRT